MGRKGIGNLRASSLAHREAQVWEASPLALLGEAGLSEGWQARDQLRAELSLLQEGAEINP